MMEVDSFFVVTDEVFHQEVVSLCNKSKTKIICYTQFENNSQYDPDLYFLSNNFLEISSEIASEMAMTQYNPVKCSKVYIYPIGI